MHKIADLLVIAGESRDNWNMYLILPNYYFLNKGCLSQFYFILSLYLAVVS